MNLLNYKIDEFVSPFLTLQVNMKQAPKGYTGKHAVGGLVRSDKHFLPTQALLKKIASQPGRWVFLCGEKYLTQSDWKHVQ